MKLTIHQDLAVSETEIIINCAHMDGRLRHLIELIRQHGFSLTGYQEGNEYQIPLEQIYFMDSADGKTFLYLEKEVYFCRDTLTVFLVNGETQIATRNYIEVLKNKLKGENL